MRVFTLLEGDYRICRVERYDIAPGVLAVVRDVSGSTTVVSRARIGGECLGPYRVLASEVLDPSLVGFLARVATVLAEASVPLMAYSSVERDYILVPSELVVRAVQVLEQHGFLIRKEREQR